jgi:hypothetical protein
MLPGRDPRIRAPVGAYLTDGKQLVQVLEVDAFGAMCEDVRGDGLVTIRPTDLMQRWRRVTPEA